MRIRIPKMPKKTPRSSECEREKRKPEKREMLGEAAGVGSDGGAEV